jgi:hypothetical protein
MNHSLSANYFSHGISRRLSNAGHPAISGVFVSRVVSYALRQADQGMNAAQAFLRKAVAINQQRWPRTVNLDGNAASHRALRFLGNEDPKWKSVVVSLAGFSEGSSTVAACTC